MATSKVHNWFATLALCSVAAISFVLLFPPTNVWPLAVVPLVLLCLAAGGASSTRMVVLWSYVSFYFAWLILHIWVLNMTIVGWLVLPLVLALYPAAFVWIMHVTFRRGSRIPFLLLVPVVWTGLEYLRGTLFMDGYPWYLIGQPLIAIPSLVQSADLFGVYGVSFFVSAISGALVDVVVWRQGEQRTRVAMISCTTAIILIAASIGYGAFRLSEESQGTRSLNVLVLQTNLQQSNKRKWEWEQQKKDVYQFAQDSVDAAAIARRDGTAPDLIVWPETMIPGQGFEQQALDFQEENTYSPGRKWFYLLQEARKLTRVPFLVGSPARIGLGVEQTDEGAKYIWERSYNSAYLIDRDALPFQRYDKVLLTPFGETMPYISNWPWLEQMMLAVGAAGMAFDLDAAEEPVQLEMNRDGERFVFATPICFEDTVPRICRELVYLDGRKADAIINLSNDGWFGWSDAGRETHAQFARFRCIENRVPMVRAANTGISMHIDSTGKIIEKVHDGRSQTLGASDWLLARVDMDERITLYSRIGNVLPATCFALTIGAVGLAFFRRTSRRTNETGEMQ